MRIARHPPRKLRHLVEAYMARVKVSRRIRKCVKSASPMRNNMKVQSLQFGIMVIGKGKKARIVSRSSADFNLWVSAGFSQA